MINHYPSDTDRVRWQRHCVNVLTTILHTHPHLPAIAWAIPPNGPTLIGRIHGLAPAASARNSFNVWRSTLRLNERSPISTACGSVHDLRATAEHDHVRIILTATLFDEWGEHQPTTPI
jgi:hypothetical protein